MRCADRSVIPLIKGGMGEEEGESIPGEMRLGLSDVQFNLSFSLQKNRGYWLQTTKSTLVKTCQESWYGIHAERLLPKRQVTLADHQADVNSPLYSAKTFEDLGL